MDFKKYLNLRFGEIEKDEIVKGLFLSGAVYTILGLIQVLFVSYFVSIMINIPVIGSIMSSIGSLVTFVVVILKPLIWIVIIKLLCEALNSLLK